MEWTKVDRIEPSGSKLNVIDRSGPKRTELDRNARLIYISIYIIIGETKRNSN